MPDGELTPFQLHGMQPVLAVRDLLKTVDYYRDMLGFHVDFVDGDPPAHARVCADPSYSSPTVHIRFEPSEAAATPNHSVYLWVHVGKGLDRLFETYRDRGVVIIHEPEDKEWGLRQFVIEDCDGYRINFSAELDAAK